MPARFVGERSLLVALALSFAIHGAVLLVCGLGVGSGGGRGALARGGISARLVRPALVRGGAPPISVGESLASPVLSPLPEQDQGEVLSRDEIVEAGAGVGVAEGPHFLEELTMSAADAERLRGLGDVDLAILISRDGKVSGIEVLRPALGAMDHAWLAAMIASAKIAPGKVDGVAVAYRWLIRISAPERIDAATG